MVNLSGCKFRRLVVPPGTLISVVSCFFKHYFHKVWVLGFVDRYLQRGSCHLNVCWWIQVRITPLLGHPNLHGFLLHHTFIWNTTATLLSHRFFLLHLSAKYFPLKIINEGILALPPAKTVTRTVHCLLSKPYWLKYTTSLTSYILLSSSTNNKVVWSTFAKSLN